MTRAALSFSGAVLQSPRRATTARPFRARRPRVTQTGVGLARDLRRPRILRSAPSVARL